MFKEGDRVVLINEEMAIGNGAPPFEGFLTVINAHTYYDIVELENNYWYQNEALELVSPLTLNEEEIKNFL